mmetsp:Transcript_7708/g.19650  ORF Transcript_7708/g.19650 Transcript_7708/m.19650 type:complete len:209 (+) Transcript_7708:3-629(+)
MGGGEGPGAGEESYGVVVTGSTKGVGRAIATAFLENGDRVVVCSRSEDTVAEVVGDLQTRFGEENVAGKVCDVSNPGQVKDLAQFAKDRVGNIDIWINNAGTNAYSFKPLVETDSAVLKEIVETNTLGVMYCLKEATAVMRTQDRTGHIFSMDGAGVTGNGTPNIAAYGSTKRGLEQLMKSVNAELSTLGIENVVLHMLSPGMVTTGE